MVSKSTKWNSIIPATTEKLGAIGIIVKYNEYFDCYTDLEFRFDENVKYSQEILNTLQFRMLNNPYFGNSDNISDFHNELSVFEEFARPIWAKFIESGGFVIK